MKPLAIVAYVAIVYGLLVVFATPYVLHVHHALSTVTS